MLELTNLNSNNTGFEQSEDLTHKIQKNITGAVGGAINPALAPVGAKVGTLGGSIAGGALGGYLSRKSGPVGQGGSTAFWGTVGGWGGGALGGASVAK